MENITNIIKESHNRHEILKKLNWDCNTSGYKKINKYIIVNNIDISHFETKQEQYERTLKISKNNKGIPLSEILISGSTYGNGTKIKKKLYAAGLKECKCEKCGQGEIWYGQHISLILDHVNGINNDNRIENLQILCPNCNAALPTHCGKNMKYKKTKKNKSIEDKFKTKRSISIKSRKNDRPSYEQLIIDVKELGYTGSGKKYGVSDNAIRKWIEFYEKYEIIHLQV